MDIITSEKESFISSPTIKLRKKQLTKLSQPRDTRFGKIANSSISEEKNECIGCAKAQLSMLAYNQVKYSISDFQFTDFDPALLESNQNEFGATIYADREAFLNFYLKYNKTREYVHKGQLSKLTPSFKFIESSNKQNIVPFPVGLVKRSGPKNLVELNGMRLGGKHINALTESLKLSSHIDELKLSHNRIDDSSACEMIGTIGKNLILNPKNKIGNLDLSYNMIGYNAIDKLSFYVCLNGCNLERLNLEGNSIGNFLARKLITSINSGLSQKLIYLNLAKNNLSDECMDLISELVFNCLNLKVLNLHENQIKNEGAALLINKCKQHTELRVLDLGWNLIGNNLFTQLTKEELVNQHRSNIPKIDKQSSNADNDKKKKSGGKDKGGDDDIDSLYNNAEIEEMKESFGGDSRKRKIEKAKVSQFALELGELFKQETVILMHLDISHNNLNIDDCIYISKTVVFNHTILGIHLDGNEMTIDELGFITPISKQANKEDYYASSQIYYDMVGFGRNMVDYKANNTNIRNIKTKNNCWICEGWKEIKLTYKPNKNRDFVTEESADNSQGGLMYTNQSFGMKSQTQNRASTHTANNTTFFGKTGRALDVKFHLSQDNYKPNDSDVTIDTYFTYRVCRPGILNYFYSVNGEPVTNYGSQLRHLTEGIVMEYEKEKEYQDDETEKKQYIVTKVAEMLVESSEIMDSSFKNKLKNCVPRPLKKTKTKIRPRTPWIYNDSFWAFNNYLYDGISEAILNEAFDHDFERSKVWLERDFKSDQERQSCKQLLRDNYLNIINVYKYFSAKEGSAIFQIGQMGMNEFASISIGLIDKNYLNEFMYIKAGETANIDKEERKKNKLLPENLVRHQFMNFLVKVAKDKYFIKTNTYPTAFEAINYTFDTHYINSWNIGENHKWRIERYYNEYCDNVIKAFYPILDAVFKSFGRRDVGKRDYWMNMDDFTNLCSIVIDSKYSIKTLPMTYAVSIKLQIDEINSDRHLQMYFDEFIEAICRVLDKLSPIPLEDDPEDWSQTSRQDQHLSQKLVNIMPIFHKNLKDDHKMIRDKFVLPKKDEGGYYTFDLASQFYANYPKGLHK